MFLFLNTESYIIIDDLWYHYSMRIKLKIDKITQAGEKNGRKPIGITF